jgi:dihydroorotate dehydrogenase
LNDLLKSIFDLHREMKSQVPILVKLAPPLTEKVVFDSLIEEVVSVCVEHGVSGIVATNTAPDRMGLSTSTTRLDKIGRGGLSGRPIFGRSTMLVNYLHGKVQGKIPIIGVGGIDSAESAFEKILAGASLVQVYTGLIYRGPKLAKSIKIGLFKLIKDHGFSTIKDAVGAGTEIIQEAAEHRSVTTTR